MDRSILTRVQGQLFRLRVREEAEQAERQAEIYEKLPRVAEIDAELGSTMAQILRAAVTDGDDPAPKMAALRRRNAESQKERAELLMQAGYPADILDMHYTCSDCKDTGYLPDGAPCHCLRELYAQEQIEELAANLPVKKASFEKFDETLYQNEPFEGEKDTPRKNAAYVREFCLKLAVLPPPGINLFIYGKPGTGKTFLAACTAVEASRRGKSVIARSMGELVSLYEREKFTYDDDTRDDAQAEIDRLMACDLLIIDNLGTEFRSPFVAATLMGILTVRLDRGKSILICSGLEPDDLEPRYSAQIKSRLLSKSEFIPLPLYGPDLRRR